MSLDFKWYVVHTYSGYEEKAKTSLMERAKEYKAEDKFGEVFIPKTIKTVVLKSGKTKNSARTSFPGYIIVQMHLDDDTNHIVKNTPKITGFIGNAKNPRPLPEHEVQRMLNPEPVEPAEQPADGVEHTADGSGETATATDGTAPAAAVIEQEAPYSRGENVKVNHGPFSGFEGVVDEVKTDKRKVRVLVSIFGRETPVELEYNQVEKLD